MSREPMLPSTRTRHLSRRTVIGAAAASTIGLAGTSNRLWTPAALAQGGTPVSGGTLTIGLNADINGMDPHLSSTTVSSQVMQSIYDALLDYDPSFNLVPKLASSWEVSEDELEYTFHLVQGITFHDGEPFNAAAVKTNIERVLDDSLGARLTSQLTSISEVRVDDDYTVSLVLSSPLALILGLMTGPAGTMISPKAIAEYGVDLARNPVGTGPFKFVEWLDDDHITVTKNDGYWQSGVPYLDQVTYRPIPDPTVRLTALRTNDVQIDDSLSAKDLDPVEQDDSLVMSTLPGLGYRYILFNSSADPFTNMALRQAVAWSIDRAAINQVLFFGHGTVATSPIPPSSWAYDPELVVYPGQDYDMATQKLQEAGMPDGFEFTMMVSNTTDDINLGEAYKDQLGEVGITVNLEPLEFQTLLDRSYAGDFQAHTGNWSGGPDPDDNVYSYFRSGGGTNRGRYLNEQVDTLLDEARSVADREARKPLYTQLARIITDEAPMIFVLHPPEVKVWQPAVQGFVPSSDQMIRTTSIWLSDAE